MKVAFLTLGCKVNHYETEVMAQAFERAGDLIVPFEEKADVYVVNTCTVTATGDKKSRQALRAAKRQNPNAVVVAVGCYAQMDPDALLSMPEVDFVLGNLHKPELPALLRQPNRQHTQRHAHHTHHRDKNGAEFLGNFRQHAASSSSSLANREPFYSLL